MTYVIGALVALAIVAFLVLGVEIKERSDVIATQNAELTAVAGGSSIDAPTPASTARTIGEGNTPTPSPTATPNTCDMDQVQAANHVEFAGDQHIEVGREAAQVIVYYTAPKSTRVTYIIGPQTKIATWKGFGQVWQERDCSDIIGWARDQSKRQVQIGHSGITVDLRTGAVYNDGDLTGEEVDALIEEQQPFRRDQPRVLGVAMPPPTLTFIIKSYLLDMSYNSRYTYAQVVLGERSSQRTSLPDHN